MAKNSWPFAWIATSRIDMKSSLKKSAEGGGLTAIDGALALVSILLIVQMWLLTATVEADLAGHHDATIPGAIISGIIFLVCIGLYLFVARIDKEMRKSEPPNRK